MNIYDAIMRDNPVAAFSFTANASSYPNIMGTTSPLTSVVASTGASSTASLAETSIVAGPTKSIVLGGEAAFRVSFNDRFSKTSSPFSFSLEAWVLFETSGAIQILGHLGRTDGLHFDGDYISMGIDLDGGGNTRARWAVPDKTKVYHLVGVYSGTKVSLYVDGEMAAESNLPDGSLLLATSATLQSGGGTGKSMRLEAPAIYNYGLQAYQVKQHYDAGRRIGLSDDNVSRLGGTMWTLSDRERFIRLFQPIDWTRDGLNESVSVQDGLRPLYDENGLSLAGSYTVQVKAANLESPVSAGGVKVTWNGDGNFVVELSVNDGLAWTPLVNGEVPISTVGMAGTVTPIVRVSFQSGRAIDLDIVRTMDVTVYEDSSITSGAGRERILSTVGTTSTSSLWREPIEDDDASGAIVNGSTSFMTMSESTESVPANVGALEMWVKFETSTVNAYLVDSRPVTPSNASYIWLNGSRQIVFAGFSSLYVNGVARTSGTFIPVVDRLYHIVANYTTPHNAKIRFGPAVNAITSYKMLSTYPAALTAAQVLALFKSYSGIPILSVDDLNTIVVSETSPAAIAYVKDWSFQGAG